MPPQSFFSCPIASIRRKVPDASEVARYTYAATRESQENKITLFKDYVDVSGNTDSTTKSVSLGVGQPVVCIAAVTVPGRQTSDEELLVVRKDGEIICLDTETLKKRWNSSSAALYQDVQGASKSNFTIDFCSPVLLSDFVQGILKSSDDALALFPEIKQGVNADAEVLVLLSRHDLNGQPIRHLHVVAVQPPSHGSASTQRRGLVQLHVVPVPSSAPKDAISPTYRLDLRSGSLLELCGQLFNVYDLTASLPRVTSTMELRETTSFLRLSKTSVLCSTSDHLNIFNPVYRSLQNSVPVDLDNQVASSTATQVTSCLLTAYFSRLELAVAIVDSNLVAIQLEAPILRTRKRRAEGLLIDSIGRGVHLTQRSSTSTSQVAENSLFSNYLPGSIRGTYWQSWTEDEAKADALLNANDIPGLELLLAEKFGIQVQNQNQIEDQNQNENQNEKENQDKNQDLEEKDASMTNGVDTETEEPILSKVTSTWKWPKTRTAYPPADRRWILYAISRAFQWNDAFPDDATIPRLICQLPQSDVVSYLVDAGHLTLSNVRSAFRGQLGNVEDTDSFLAEQIVLRLADVDPSLELLGTYIAATNLGAVELLVAVRTIMRSLELVQDPKQPPPKLLTNGSTEEAIVDGEAEAEAEFQNIGMELDDLEDEIQKGMSYLNEDAGVRSKGLTVAFAKLGNCPNISTIKALRTAFKPEEILSLIYLLRIELVRGAWTSRYLDTTDYERDTNLEAPPEGIIKLIADLLCRCVDSVGPGGWLLNDAVLAGDETGDFIAALKLEVSAALEGVEQAIILRGIVGEAVKFCEASSKKASAPESAVDKMKPIPLQVKEPGAQALPLGLKTKDRISSQKVVAGGEVIDRSLRETGHLRSQQVGQYSLERIAI